VYAEQKINTKREWKAPVVEGLDAPLAPYVLWEFGVKKKEVSSPALHSKVSRKICLTVSARQV
jgi:hypothetical protein